MAEIKKLLDDAIKTEINNLNSASDKDEKSEVIKNLTALHKLRIEEIKTETEIEEKSERRAMDKAAHDEDATLKAFQLDENTLDRYAKIGIAAAELVLPLMFYGVWMSRGLRFEETGTFTSQTFKNLFNRFKPNHTPGSTDIYTVTMTDGSKYNIAVYNGLNGTGTGDVLGIHFDLVLPASGWSNGSITVAESRLVAAAKYKYLIDAYEASREEYLECNVRPKDISTTGFITFVNDTDPIKDITVNIVRLELSVNAEEGGE